MFALGIMDKPQATRSDASNARSKCVNGLDFTISEYYSSIRGMNLHETPLNYEVV